MPSTDSVCSWLDVDSQIPWALRSDMSPSTDALVLTGEPSLSPKQSHFGFSPYSKCAAFNLTTCWEMGRQ